VVGGLKGGAGTASTVLPSGVTVGVIAAVNAAGSAVDPATGVLYGEMWDGIPAVPDEGVHAEAQRRLADAREETGRRSAGVLRPPLNTTLAVVATDAVLTRAQAQKMAGTAHDGLARAVRPVHLMHDGDTVFSLATGERPLANGELNDLLAAAADVLTRAVVKAVLAAEGVDGPGGVFPCYRDLYGRPAGPSSSREPSRPGRG
jgi:putative pantetheine hydrolase